MPGELTSTRKCDSVMAFGAFRTASSYDPFLILSQIATLFSFFHFIIFLGESLVCRYLQVPFVLWSVWDLKITLNLATTAGRMNFIVYLIDSIIM